MEYSIFKQYDKKIIATSTERAGYFATKGEEIEGVSKNDWGKLNLCHYVDDKHENVKKNRELFCKFHKIEYNNLIIPRQTHTNRVKVIDKTFLDLDNIARERELNDVDALVSNIKNLCIGINTADCIPLIIFDTKHQAAAVVHAGWRGLSAHIARNAINTMQTEYHTMTDDIICAIGPCISSDNYEVGGELVDIFENEGFSKNNFIQSCIPNKFNLDLRKALVEELIKLGIKHNNIEVSNICTYQECDKFFSARKLGIKSGRIFSSVILR